ncbi:MAG TPA: TetR/AcrR family transcriptional regulator [Pirellulales bacterium]|nr:TetR/AcrR family transcriptional regulator [Pirellulales bacterium]
MPPSSKKLGRPTNTALRARRRDEILDAAARLFAERGYAAADTQSLSDALGIGKGTLYRHFASKRDLFLAAVNRAMDRLDERIEQALASVADPIDRFEAAITAYLRFFNENPEVTELLIQERALFKGIRKPAYFERNEACAERKHEMLAELMRAGRLRAMPVDRIGRVLGDQLYGTMLANFFAGRRDSVADQAEAIVDVMFHGILTDRERASRNPSSPSR